MKEWELTIGADWAGAKAETVLRRAAGMAPSYISALKFRPGGITCNGEPAASTQRLRPGDVLRARIDDAGGGNAAEPMAVPLSFVYEDEYLAVLNKRAPMAVHGSLSGGECTVANALAALWGPEQAFHPVNRLDRGTSGLMVLARSGYIHDRLRRQLHSEDFCRVYLGIVLGRPPEPRGSVTLPLGPREGDGRRGISPDGGQEARTDYRLLECRSRAALLELRLFTGRTHQIRAHMAALGHPLAGDVLYGAGEEPGLERPALHSWRIRLRHPVTRTLLELEAPFPADLRDFWESLPSRQE